MVGLLGVAAVIPLGGREIAEAGKSDRMTACGQAILHDVKVRGFLNPRGWRYQDGTSVVTTSSNGQTWLPCRTYAIDPMFVAYANSRSLANAARFPYGSVATDMTRVTIARALTGAAVLSTSEAERLCTWNDDLLFPIPEEPEDRPRQQVLADMGSNTTDSIRWPVRASDGVAGSPKALRDENGGSFTWMLTVTPIGKVTTISGVDYVNVDQPLTYQVSVVLFFNRSLGSVADFTSPERGERPISINFYGGGLSGGDVEITPSLAEELQENNWMMVAYAPTGSSSRPYEWYRVVAADEWETGASVRYATLEGRDWTFTNTSTTAVWFPDAIGVFTATIPSESRD